MFGARTVLLVAALGTAPFQCSRTPDPDAAIEETPGEALYRLAGEFRSRGDVASFRATLVHLVKHYPGSRQAKMAAAELAATPDEPEAAARRAPASSPAASSGAASSGAASSVGPRPTP